MIRKPNPGSTEAIKQGCTCLVDDNGRGFGAYGGLKDMSGQPLFLIDPECPIHGSTSEADGSL